MPREQWPLRNDRPCVQVVLTFALTGQLHLQSLLADTGAGSMNSGFDLILEEDDCLHCGGIPLQPVTLRGAFTGSFPTYLLQVQIPVLAFAQNLRAVGVPAMHGGFDGLACSHS